MNLELLDLAMRGAATGMAVLLMGLIATSRIAQLGRIAFSLTVICLLSRVWSTAPSVHLGETALFALRLIGSGGAFASTWFLLMIFLDDSRFRWVWLTSAASIVIGLLLLLRFPALVPYLRALAVLHYGALLALVLLIARDDLQEARRSMRPAIAAFLIFYAIGMTLTSSQMRGAAGIHTALGQSGVTLLVVAVIAFWALKVNILHWPGETVASTAPTPEQRSHEYTALITRITAEMAAGIWQTEGLTVGGRAQRVKAPEHQVRRAINQVLGHRNFAAFINSASIDAAKAKLSAPEGQESTILEIAYDVGFASLGPFNRAFRDATGLSPTDFRKKAIGAA